MADNGPRVMVAMSGGVDSSVAALLLQQSGYRVVGVTFKLFTNEVLGCAPDRACCSEATAEAARAVCQRLGVPHYTLSFVADFEELIIRPFMTEYAAGRTPNPCVLCNREIKFDRFLSRALATGAEYIATGHYGRIARQADGTYRLLPGVDPGKDQSYALCHLNQTTLPRVLLPIGDYTKQQVRELAREHGLPTADTPESQDICFAPDGDYHGFLQRQGVSEEPGPIVSVAGEVLGQHSGLAAYTVGQRQGLGLSNGPWYVVERRVADGALVVGALADVQRQEVVVEDVNWCTVPAGEWDEAPGPLLGQLRYRSASVPCTLIAQDPAARIITLRFTTPLVAAPGQYAVLYHAEEGHVIAGGVIRG